MTIDLVIKLTWQQCKADATKTMGSMIFATRQYSRRRRHGPQLFEIRVGLFRGKRCFARLPIYTLQWIRPYLRTLVETHDLDLSPSLACNRQYTACVQDLGNSFRCRNTRNP